MPAIELYDLFIEKGLKVDKDLQNSMSKAHLADCFKSEFELLSQGISQRSDRRYMHLAERTKVIYVRITGSND